MAKKIVILGGGTGGTLMANRLRKTYDQDEVEIAVVDKDDRHVYQPGLLFVPFGLARIDEIVRPRRRQLHSGIAFHETEIDHVELDDDRVHLADGTHPPLRRPDRRHRHPPRARGDRGAHRPRLDGEGLHLLHARGRRRRSREALTLVRRRPARREHRRHADQVPRRTDRVRVPRRLVPARARHPRQDGDRPRDAARRLLHEADRLEAPRRTCSRRRRSGSRSSSPPARSTATVAASSRYDGREIPFDLLVTVPAPLRRGVRRPLARARRRARLRADEPAHAAVARAAERLRARRRDERPDVEGRLRDALRGRAADARTSAASSPASRSTSRTTATRTASSRPASARRC